MHGKAPKSTAQSNCLLVADHSIKRLLSRALLRIQYQIFTSHSVRTNLKKINVNAIMKVLRIMTQDLISWVELSKEHTLLELPISH